MSPCPGQVELDGAWWPHSRDLSHELPALADVLDPLWGRITRIAVNPRYWPIIPQRIFVNGHVVKVGWFTTQLDPHKILLLSGTSGRWDLLVITPGGQRPVGRPPDGRRECEHRPAADRDRSHDGGTGRRPLHIGRRRHRMARPAGGGGAAIRATAAAMTRRTGSPGHRVDTNRRRRRRGCTVPGHATPEHTAKHSVSPGSPRESTHRTTAKAGHDRCTEHREPGADDEGQDHA
ncbi:DUF5994 family protein [Streptomyces sp. SAI-090]|uniref:DUF5994 family protein n=1 Tax=Streptomyces sp. SAI-090 TaxID=2940545 RepID=UPI0032AE8FD7